MTQADYVRDCAECVDLTPIEQKCRMDATLLTAIEKTGTSPADFLFIGALDDAVSRRASELCLQRKLTEALETVEYLWRP